MAKKRQQRKMNEYQEACAAIRQAFLPAKLQGYAGKGFLHHFDQLVIKGADQIGEPVTALAIYCRQLSLTLKGNVAQAINFRLMTLYTDPVVLVGTDEIALTGVMVSQSLTSVGIAGRDR